MCPKCKWKCSVSLFCVILHVIAKATLGQDLRNRLGLVSQQGRFLRLSLRVRGAKGWRHGKHEHITYTCVCVCANVSMSPPPILFPAHIAARAGAYSAHNNFRSFPPPIRGRRGHCIIRPGVATQHLGGGAERAIPGLSPHTHPSLPPSSSSSYSHRLPFARSQPAPPFCRVEFSSLLATHTHTPPIVVVDSLLPSRITHCSTSTPLPPQPIARQRVCVSLRLRPRPARA